MSSQDSFDSDETQPPSVVIIEPDTDSDTLAQTEPNFTFASINARFATQEEVFTAFFFIISIISIKYM